MAEIKIKYHNPNLLALTPAHKGEWIDLRAAEDVDLKAGDFKLINLGISVKVPDGYESIVAPRSSTFKNFGIIQTNSIGVIDNAYSGEDDVWFYPVLAIRDTHIAMNDRIAQFRVQPVQPPFGTVKVDHMEYESRGGHGSTGVK